MERVRNTLRSGAWLTRERVRLVAAALLIASALGFLFLVATAHGSVDRQGRPLGTDFSDVYAAGTYADEGNATAAFDPVQQFAREQAMFGADTPFYGWHYPPFFLFVAGALALMPYGVALSVWLVATLALYLLAIRAIVSSAFRGPQSGRAGFAIANTAKPFPHQNFWTGSRFFDSAPVDSGTTGLWLLLALAFPAVLINVGHGQNGFLTAALLGGALAVLDRRPILAGIMIGLLIYKPQFGLMIPVALAVSGRWHSFAAAAATAVAATIATTIVFGASVWHAFALFSEFTRTVVLEQGNTGWYKIQSVFAWARMWGAPVALAYAVQGATIIAIGAAIAWLWRGPAPYPLKAAALCLATILATPYSFDYDMMVLAPAIAFFAAEGFARGFGPWEKTALAALWLVPLVARSVAQLTLIPLGVPAMFVAFILILRRAAFGRARRYASNEMTFFDPAATMAMESGGGSRGHDIASLRS